MTSDHRVSVYCFVEFWHNKLFILTDKGLVMLNQRSDLFRLRDLEWFDYCENFKFSAVCPPKCKMKVLNSVNEMKRTWRQFGQPLACFAFAWIPMHSFSLSNSNNLIIFTLETVPMSMFYVKLFFSLFSGRWMICISDRACRLATRHISQPKRKLMKSKAPMKNHQFVDILAFKKV